MVNPETILIVDDDPAIREMMANVISSYSKSYKIAADGLEALEFIQKNNIDIVISDINLPKLDGLTLLNRTKEIKPETAFIVITGYSQDYSYDRVIKAGAKDFIKKPFTLTELDNKLKRILHERRIEQENRQLLIRQTRLNKQLATVLDVASDLTQELDFDRLFSLIIGKITGIMLAERTSFYIIDWDKREIWTKVAEGIGQIHLLFGEGISGRVAETGETINVADAWALPYFNREFDRKHNFRTKSVLCTPVKNSNGQRIGVLQVINKKDKECFDKEDEFLLVALSSQVGIALENSLLHEELRLSFESSIRTLSAVVDARHPLTAGHSERVTEYSKLIAAEMGLSKKEIEVLTYAALLHDIGKIGIRDDVLLKNGPFTPEERSEMNAHPLKAKVILENFRFPKSLKDVPEIASHHHEKVNGKGYPNGLTGDNMSVGSKIIAVADVFDALTSPRDYPKYTLEKALECDRMPLPAVISILKKDIGSHFDQDVVHAFLGCLPQALLHFREVHFPPEYVDEVLQLNMH
jgi:response regulator RpfG family c-di-GMP phosphodiesterase